MHGPRSDGFRGASDRMSGNVNGSAAIAPGVVLRGRAVSFVDRLRSAPISAKHHSMRNARCPASIGSNR